MTRCFLDTNLLYAHVRRGSEAPEPELSEWRERAFAEVGPDAGVTTGLVQDELAYRLVLAWLWEDGEADPLSVYRRDERTVMRSMADRLRTVWTHIDAMQLELARTDHAVVRRARVLMGDPGLAPRDAFHAAHALEAGCPVIVSSDDAFDAVPGLWRLGP